MKKLILGMLLIPGLIHGADNQENSWLSSVWNVASRVATSPVDLLAFGIDNLRETNSYKALIQSPTAKWLDQQLDTPNKQEVFGAIAGGGVVVAAIFLMPASLLVGSAGAAATVAGGTPTPSLPADVSFAEYFGDSSEWTTSGIQNAMTEFGNR